MANWLRKEARQVVRHARRGPKGSVLRASHARLGGTGLTRVSFSFWLLQLQLFDALMRPGDDALMRILGQKEWPATTYLQRTGARPPLSP